MIAPFVVIGLLFTAGALLWARHKAQLDDGPDAGTESLERGGES
jgi:hypothetical protein